MIRRLMLSSLAGAVLVGATAGVGAGDAATGALVRSVEFISKPYLVDRKYKSMTGPQSTQTIFLLDSPRKELLWVTGFKAVMVGEDGVSPESQEFMCHSNLDINMNLHRRLFGLERPAPNRMFTLSQGQQEIRFPEGFGIPMFSTEPFLLTTQVLNHNVEGRSLQVRHKVTVDFVRDIETKTPMKPLLQLSANGLVLVDGKDGYFNIPNADQEVHGPGCLVGQSATDASRLIPDQFGRRFTGHWLVKPGREVNRTNVTRFLNLPFDTTIHYIAVHLHPFAESLELRDLTEDRTLFHSKVRPTEGKIGLDHVDYFSSVEGILLRKDHEYELVSVYNNTSAEDQDSMAVMYLYALDHEFKRPEPS
ncbi:MAG TPA: hypothetical protein VFP98_00245 [Candidatus Polarisedimenticolia bacterium]|nr:hypothetical protein [Candidatus Polarisedimenticolia bacterium]